jgi:2-polyprenyl-3-methyl-5-hydroxy-6-metoxy-1,4-benzoquinol methylase
MGIGAAGRRAFVDFRQGGGTLTVFALPLPLAAGYEEERRASSGARVCRAEMMTQNDSGPPPSYFSMVRREIFPFLPARVERMLDVGCGAGVTSAAIRRERQVAWAGGIEYLPDVARAAEAVCDRVWTGDAAAAPLEDEIALDTLDLVLCLDVLEHMADPWTMVQRLSALIAPGGRLIVSVPNIRHWKFIWRLLTRGDFRYRDAGLLDRTHLRFFVRETAIELATAGGLRLVTARSATDWRAPDARWLLSRLTGGAADELMAKQWLIVADKPAETRH